MQCMISRVAQVRREDFDFSVPKGMCRGVKDQIELQKPERANLLLHFTTHPPPPSACWVAVKELKLSYHNGYIYIYSK